MKASTPPWCMSRTAVVTSPVRCWARRIPRCTDFGDRCLSFRGGPRGPNPESQDSGSSLRAVRNDGKDITPKNKKDQLALALRVFCCVRPGPDDPGGLGAEESEIDRTEPTQCFLFPR